MNNKEFCVVQGVTIPYEPNPPLSCLAARYALKCSTYQTPQDARKYEVELSNEGKCVIIHYAHPKIVKLISFPDNTLAIFDITKAPRIIIAYAPKEFYFDKLKEALEQKKKRLVN